MNQEEISKRLKAPFSFDEIDWRVLTTNQDKSRGIAAAYLSARSVQQRLDDVVGVFNWKNEYKKWDTTSQLCGISIFDDERGEWITKYDGAENSDIESVKGGISDAFKRAAVLFGIGRYLYELGNIWVETEARGKSFAIKADQYGKLEAEYNKTVAKIFGSPANHSISPPGSSSNQSSVSTAPSQAPQPSAANTSSPTQPEVNNQSSETPADDYTIKSMKPSGKSSQILELVDGNGEITAAYVKSGDKSIAIGFHLHGVRMEKRSGSYGAYNLITAYKAA